MKHDAALFVSPHFDDVVFSCGATAAKLAAAGTHVLLCTVFSASRSPMSAFALECQVSKGIPPSTDYLALRRMEDAAAALTLFLPEVLRLDFLEAPYRDYQSAAELFQPCKPADENVPAQIAGRILEIAREFAVRRAYFPAGIGGHVDHVLTVSASRLLREHWSAPVDVRFYEELPYAIRGGAPPLMTGEYEPVADFLERKLQAAACYSSQLGFQFGGVGPMRRKLAEYAERIGREAGLSIACERFFPAPV